MATQRWLETTFGRVAYVGITLEATPSVLFAAVHDGDHLRAVIAVGRSRARELTDLIRAARTAFRRGDWGCDVEDVSADKLGWDLSCTHPDGSTAKVEVKGVSGNRPVVLLTANEIRAAHEEPHWVLAVVTRALVESREILAFNSREALAAAAPLTRLI